MQYQKFELKLGGDQGLMSLARQVVVALREWNEDIKPTLGGVRMSLRDVEATADFNLLGFEFEHYTAEAGRLYEDLLEAVDKRGEGVGAVVSYTSDYASHIEAYGDVKKRAVDLDTCDVEWYTDALGSVRFEFGEGVLLGLVEHYGDPDDDIAYGSRNMLEAILGSETADELLGDEEDPTDVDLDAGEIAFYANDDWRFGTIDDFRNRKKTFEAVVEAVKENEGNVEVFWADESGDESGNNVFISSEGFMSLQFKTGLNQWGDFEAVSYSLPEAI